MSDDNRKFSVAISNDLALLLVDSLKHGGDDKDGRWSVKTMEAGIWSIDHEDLPVVLNSEGEQRDHLLQMHLKQLEDGDWLVIGQNASIGEDTLRPEANVIARLPEEAGKWDLQEVADAAANYFMVEKGRLVQQKIEEEEESSLFGPVSKRILRISKNLG